MALLIAGVVFWSIAHLVPSAVPGVRRNLAGKLGEGPYKGLFAIDILLALGLIIFGWRSAVPTAVYAPPLFDSQVPLILIAVGIILFVVSAMPNNFKRFIRHPQMTAVILWSSGHLLANGDSRSLVLFGGFGVWAILEIVFINKRDGAWEKPDAVPALQGMLAIVLAVIVVLALARFHSTFSGVAIILT
jgi:uncharacterized membrane protein